MGAAVAVMLVGAACSKKSQTASSPPVVTTPPATSAVSPGPTPAAAITVQQTGGFRFKPATLTVKTGQQITVTTFKCFLYDLSSLGGLYRIGSLVGLAFALTLVSIALQKFVLRAPKALS